MLSGVKKIKINFPEFNNFFYILKEDNIQPQTN
jgi:hypothetical protein